MSKRSWRFIVVSINAGQYNPYAGIARHVNATSARNALNLLQLPRGEFYGLIYEPRTRAVISAAVRVDGLPARNIPPHRGTELPINTPLATLEEYVRSVWGAV